ncbi:glutathione S-transferase family protein [Maricaulis sp.]|uniref:glutathione S-transferase family protein n=1 Tax=Maricaulis sp. TaxID=1486257 RepID=UPI003A9011BA
MRSYRLITSPESIASSKVRLYLRWKNIPFRETVASRLVIKSEVRPRIQKIDLPVFITPSNDTVQDSRAIMDFVERRERGEALTPDRAEQAFACRLLEGFSDTWLTDAINHRVWRGADAPIAGIMAATLYPEADDDRRSRIAKSLHARVLAQLSRRGFNSGTVASTDGLLVSFLALLEAHLSCSAFIFGDRPSIADFAIAAALTTLRDSAPQGAALITKSPKTFTWLSAVNAPQSPQIGAGRAVAGLPKTLVALLSFAAAQFLPHALATADAVGDWGEANPGKLNLPKRVGQSARFDDDLNVRRDFRPQTQWLLQRMLDVLVRNHSKAEKDALARSLDAIGCASLAGYKPRRTVCHEHHNFRLDLVDRGDAYLPEMTLRRASDLMSDVRRDASDSVGIENLVTG